MEGAEGACRWQAEGAFEAEWAGGGLVLTLEASSKVPNRGYLTPHPGVAKL
jgi:hypothetical protein